MVPIEDAAIVDLYFARNEDAIVKTQQKFGSYLLKIAMNILTSRPDSEECVNDTYLRAWNTIPPQRPNILSTFLGKITRNLSIDRLRHLRAAKRSAQQSHRETDMDGSVIEITGAQYDLSLSELEEVIPSEARPDGKVADTVGEELEAKELGRAISEYLRTISEEARKLFIYRYYDMESVKDAASLLGITEGKAKTLLFRTRAGLRTFLEKEGYQI
ncbi:MAG: RNA polymerase sigma factor [Firmicutes bacterium]|nr:RNA polymerase sigma factor [Bacillota bacterium]